MFANSIENETHVGPGLVQSGVDVERIFEILVGADLVAQQVVGVSQLLQGLGMLGIYRDRILKVNLCVVPLAPLLVNHSFDVHQLVRERSENGDSAIVHASLCLGHLVIKKLICINISE